MDWVEITVTCRPEATEAVAGILSELGSRGVVIHDPTSVPSHEGWDYYDPPGGDPTVTGSVALEEGVQAETLLAELTDRLAFLAEAVPEWGQPIFSSRVVQDRDWASYYRQFYELLRIGRRVVVIPAWEEYQPTPDEVPVRLDIGMAFGTGTHATTAMCLELLQETVQPGDRVIDWGCGSGILAIAAAGLGAARVEAVDIDGVAVEAAQHNLALNPEAAGRVNIARGSIEELAGLVEGVSANIVADVVIPRLGQVARVLVPNGWLVVSGIVADRREELEAGLAQAGFQLARLKQAGEWIAALCRRAGG
ncbi:MAG: 50S ribosomal protein L11 methyltransferase [Bacillota bacterium]